MPTPILDGPVGQNGKGSKVCTVNGKTLLAQGMKLGPDGNGWVLLSEHDLEALVQEMGAKKFRHISKAKIEHLCAYMGGWAFKVFDSSLPMAVSFLHIKSPSKLDAVMGNGDGSVVNQFSCDNLMSGYLHAKEGWRCPRIWRRTTLTWDEIAINFCIRQA